MPTTLTSPVVLKQITYATVDRWQLNLARQEGGVGVDAARSSFTAFVTTRDQNGAEFETKELKVFGPQLPAPLVAAIQEFHAAVIQALRDASLLPAGNDTPDI